MTPRKYELSERAESREATKQRIVEATIALHREQGVVATSYRHVAERADVGIGTVYRHFPTLDDLVMACGGRLLEITKPPTVEAFIGVRSRRARLATLVSEVFGWYERYPQWRRAICDADKLEVLARGVQRRDELIRVLVETALGPEATPPAVTAVRALLNYEVYRTLTDHGHTASEAADILTNVLASGIGAVDRPPA